MIYHQPFRKYLLEQSILSKRAGIFFIHLTIRFRWQEQALSGLKCSKIFPTYLLEGLEFHLRASAYPFILHFWVWPLLLLASAFILRKEKGHAYLLAAGAGWALHLALDGIVTLI